MLRALDAVTTGYTPSHRQRKVGPRVQAVCLAWPLPSDRVAPPALITLTTHVDSEPTSGAKRLGGIVDRHEDVRLAGVQLTLGAADDPVARINDAATPLIA